MYIYIYIYTNLLVNSIVRLPHPWSRGSLGQETFLAPSADKQTCNYDTRVLKPPFLPINTKVKGSCSVSSMCVINITNKTQNFQNTSGNYKTKASTST